MGAEVYIVFSGGSGHTSILSQHIAGLANSTTDVSLHETIATVAASVTTVDGMDDGFGRNRALAAPVGIAVTSVRCYHLSLCVIASMLMKMSEITNKMEGLIKAGTNQGIHASVDTD